MSMLKISFDEVPSHVVGECGRKNIASVPWACNCTGTGVVAGVCGRKEDIAMVPRVCCHNEDTTRVAVHITKRRILLG